MNLFFFSKFNLCTVNQFGGWGEQKRSKEIQENIIKMLSFSKCKDVSLEAKIEIIYAYVRSVEAEQKRKWTKGGKKTDLFKMWLWRRAVWTL